MARLERFVRSKEDSAPEVPPTFRRVALRAAATTASHIPEGRSESGRYTRMDISKGRV